MHEKFAVRRRSSGHEESLDSTAAAASAAGLDTDTFFIDGTRIQGVVPLHTPASAAGAASSSVLLAGHFTESTLSSGKLRVEVVLKLARDDDPSSLELLRSEAQVLESLKGGTGSGCIDLYHAHLDATTSPNGRPYLVLERFGESITALLHPGCQLIPIAINRTVLAVAALHSHGIMHGDIKPGNILFVERHGMLDVKLCDLECARRVGEPFPHDGQSLRYTELYASPEVLRGKAGELKASLEMDLFSLGLVLWQLANKQSELPAFLQNSSERDELYAATQEQLDAKLRTVSREGGAYYLLGTAFELCRLAPAERPSAVTLAGKLTMSVTSLHQQAQLGHRLDNIGQSVDSLSGKMDQLLIKVHEGFNGLHTQLNTLHGSLCNVMLHAGDEVTAMLANWTDIFDKATRSSQLASDPTAAASILQSVSDDLQKSLAGAATDAVNEQLGAALEPVLAQLQAVSLQVTASAEAHSSSSDTTKLLAYVQEQMGKLHSEIADVKQDLTSMLQLVQELGVNISSIMKSNSALAKSVATLAESTAQANEEQAVKVRALIASMESLKVYPEMLESVQGKLTLLLRDTHSIPTLVVVLPKVHHSFVSKLNPMRILKKEAVMFFVCSETLQVVPCGKDGNGIPLSDYKDAVKKAAPVLTVGLICLKLGLLAGGVPLPLPIGGISKLLSGDGELCQQYLDSAVGLLGNTIDAAGDDDTVLSSELVVDGLQQKLDRAKAGDEAALKALHGTLGAEGTRKAYEALKQLFEAKGINVARDSGLRQVICEDKVAWVQDKDEVEQTWRAKVLMQKEQEQERKEKEAAEAAQGQA